MRYAVAAKSFSNIRSYLSYSPQAKWLAVACSVVSAVMLLVLLPVVYLFVDLLSHNGVPPSYGQLTQARQAEFRENWDRLSENPVVGENVNELLEAMPIVAASGGENDWSVRWIAYQATWLERSINERAADQFLEDFRQAGVPEPPISDRTPLGIVGTIARHPESQSARFLGRIASWNSWTWQPGETSLATQSYLTGLFIFAFAIALLRGLILNLGSYCAMICAQEGVTRIRRNLFTHSYRLTAVTVKEEAQQEAGELLSHRVEQIYDGFAAWMTTAIRSPILAIGAAIILILAHPMLALSLLSLGGLVWVVTGQVAAWYRRDARVAMKRFQSSLSLMQESLFMIQLMKGYLMDRFGQNRLERQVADLRKAGWRRLKGEAASRFLLTTVTSLAALLMLYISALVVQGGGLSLAGMVMIVVGLVVVGYSLNRTIAANITLRRARSAAADVLEYLDRRGEPGQPIDAKFLGPLSTSLDFVEVSVREPGTGRMILEAMSMKIPAGKKVAIVFANVHEAHTMAYLLDRYLDPTAGEIRWDDTNIRWVTYESLRTQVCLVLEQSLSFSDTVANNIGCGDQSFSLPQIIEAAKLAHAHQFIQALPYGYETHIGELGIPLSLGQRIRLALARALLRDPSVLVYEEPAGQIDADSLALIEDCLKRAREGRTLIILSRRPSTLKTADEVYVLQGGRVVSSGTHDELMKGNDLYRHLHFRQSLLTQGSAQ